MSLNKKEKLQHLHFSADEIGMGSNNVGKIYCSWGLILLGPVFFIFLSFTQTYACEEAQRVPGEYLVRYNNPEIRFNKKSNLSFDDFLNNLKLRSHSLFKRKVTQKKVFGKIIENTPSIPNIKLVANVSDPSLLIHPDVLSIEPNCYIKPMNLPDDTEYNQQWAHKIIKSEKAWDISIGTTDVIVAVSDSGIDYNHPDLKQQMWINESEKNGQEGIDDDNNGYVDDIYGYDTADNDGDPKPGSASSASHGTHIAGIIGAVGNNNRGITGMNWKTRLMAVKGFFDDEEGTTISALIETIYYAVNNGAQVINCSWGSQAIPSQAEEDAFTYAKNNNVVVIAAAGNSAKNANEFSPAAIKSVITVAASGKKDQLASFSNYGSIVDLMAPGGDAPQYGGEDETILSTVPDGKYKGMRGTSMAAPYVAGLAALVLSLKKDLSANKVEEILKSTADSIDVRVPKTGANYTYLRINAEKALMETWLKYGDSNSSACEIAQPGDLCDQGSVIEDISSGTDSFRSAITQGMGGCGKMESKNNEASFANLLILFITFLMPICFSIYIKKDH